MKRRTWILSALGATGALVVGWSVLPQRSRLGSPSTMPTTEGDIGLNGWIKISPLGQVILAMPRSEMGQGVHTALAMLVAEELDVALDRVQLEQAGHDKIYGNVAMFVASLPFHPLESKGKQPPTTVRVGEWMVGKVARELGISVTGGSSSIADAWDPLRLAAASARAQLLAAASKQWGVPVAQLSIADGVVRGPGQQAHFGVLAAAAAPMQPSAVAVKAPNDWKLIGQGLARTDIPSKTRGAAVFGLDVRLPGMLYAAAVMCPQIDGSLVSLDEAQAIAIPGVKKLVRLAAVDGSTPGFAVVAKSTWHARKAAAAVQAQWAPRAQGALNTADISKALATALEQDSGFAFYEKGDAAAAEVAAGNTLQARYAAPYLAHATLEPMNCTARVVAGQVDVWVPTQVPGQTRAAAARVAGVDAEQVRVHVTQLGGGFGRRLEVDFVAQAVAVAMACDGQPVQLSWSREEDMRHDFYRPMHVADLKASFDAQGKVQSLRIKSAGDAITPRWMARTLPALAGPVDMPDKTTAEGLFDLPYGVAHQHMAHVATTSGVPVGFWRSVGHSHNAFFSESFIDEMTVHTGQDPLAFRRSLLTQAPRYLAVLDLAAQKAEWGKPLPTGHAQGIALHKSFGSIVAQVAQVSMEGGQPRVHKVVCAVDCGTVVNPQTVAQQMEGAVVFGLTAALYGRIDIEDSVVQQTQFTDYRMLGLAQAPLVQTYIVPSREAPTGVGEPGVPPIAPAVANALFVLTKKRQRALPFVL
jgi:isoquinoline 1-oxidoreductase beta subunit